MPDLSLRANDPDGRVFARAVGIVSEAWAGRGVALPPEGVPALRAAARRDDGADSGEFGVDGYACVTNAPYTMRDWLGEYSENVVSGAFAEALGRPDDVALLYNHEGIALASNYAGTLDLAEDDIGLRTAAALDVTGSPHAASVASAIRRGDCRSMSFAFRILDQQWSPDYTQLDIKRVELVDVSAVTFPANPSTSIGMRHLFGPASAPARRAGAPRRAHAERALLALD